MKIFADKQNASSLGARVFALGPIRCFQSTARLAPLVFCLSRPPLFSQFVRRRGERRSRTRRATHCDWPPFARRVGVIIANLNDDCAPSARARRDCAPAQLAASPALPPTGECHQVNRSINQVPRPTTTTTTAATASYTFLNNIRPVAPANFLELLVPRAPVARANLPTSSPWTTRAHQD